MRTKSTTWQKEGYSSASAYAKALIEKGYYQVSRKYQTLARLPEGMTGKQALLEEAKKDRPWDAEWWVNYIGERDAGDFYLRCHAPFLEVDTATFRHFRRLGGETYS